MNMESTDSERGRDMITRASIVEAGLMADSSIAWEKKRQLWLAPKRSASSDEEGRNDAVKTSFVDEAGSTSTTKPMRRRIVNPATVERARLLEELLDEAIRQDVMKRRDAANSAASTLALDAGSSSASAAVPAASKVMKDMGARGDEPDGGVVIRIENKGTLAEATRAILSAFREGRRLKDPLPLNLVTKLFYRSWLSDGTIPVDYSASSNSTPSIIAVSSLSPPRTVETTVFAAPRREAMMNIASSKKARQLGS